MNEKLIRKKVGRKKLPWTSKVLKIPLPVIPEVKKIITNFKETEINKIKP